MKLTIPILTVVTLLSGVPSEAWQPPVNSPLARREHPRLWLTVANLPSMRAKLAGDFKSEYQAFVTYMNGSLVGSPSTQDLRDQYLLDFAFIYAVGPVTGIDYGGRTMADYLARARDLFGQVLTESTMNNDSLPYAYDWLYHALSPTERAKAAVLFKRLEYASSGNPFNGYDIFARARHVAGGLAFWGDGIDDTAADAMVNRYETLISHPDTGLLDAGTFLAGHDGGWGQGLSYSINVGLLLRLLETVEAWRTANAYTRDAVFGASNARVLRYYPTWITYHILPHGTPTSNAPSGYDYKLYRTHHMEAGVGVYDWGALDAAIAALRLYKTIAPDTASLAQWLMEERTGVIAGGGVEGRAWSVLSNFVLGEKGITPRSPSALDLSLSKTFAGLGWVVMRTGWDALTDSMVTFTAGRWSRSAGTYTNRDQGTFTVDRRGPLVLNSGVAIHHSYSNSTWSGNTLLFVDPLTTPSGDYPDRGGQRVLFPVLKDMRQLTPNRPHDLGGIKRQWAALPGAASDMDYVFADLTRAYNGTPNADGQNAPKVRSFTRQFVYFRPTRPGESDRMVIFDRAESTDPRYEKRWLLHPTGTPQVDGSGVQEREGRWSYRDAGLVTTTNTADASFGRLFARTLLPLSRRIVKIGGPGHEFEDPYGVNDPEVYVSGKVQYIGTYRIEVIPSAPNTKDVFLHVLEATDADVTSPSPTSRLEGTGFVGARVGRRIAAFSREETVLESGDVVIDEPGAYRVLLCDLRPGVEYEIGVGARQMASPAGTVYLDVSVTTPNTRLTVRSTGVRLGQPPSAPGDIRMTGE